MASNAVADPLVSRPWRVKRRIREAHDTFTLEIESRAGESFPFTAGQFNMLHVHGVGEVPISISSNPAETALIRHTTREVGPVTKAMRKLDAGDTIGVRGPMGVGWPIEAIEGRDVVLVAGGIGLAPLRPALYRLIAEREKYGKIVLLYGTRSPQDILFKHELEHWRAQFDLEIHVTVDRAIGTWRGHVGVVTTLIARAPFDPLETVALVCGPEIMMRYTLMELGRRGVRESDMYLSMERNMKCGIGTCGHCQMGPFFVCRDGPVFNYAQIKWLLGKAEV
ncbi:FAD/NAD(P)-binding protein [bacterium]|nr:FAD/NAD(P)-binding protein [bacterium]